MSSLEPLRFKALFRPQDKREAEQARTYWRRVKLHGAYAATVLGGLTGAGRITAWLPATACAAAAWFADAKHDAFEELAKDPPRYDFTTPSRQPVQRRFYLEELGTSVFERALQPLSEVTLAGAATLHGFVRAVERAAGAAEREQPEYVSMQLDRAVMLKQQAIGELRASPRAVEPLATALDQGTELHAAVADVAPAALRPRRPVDELPDEALALLYRLGVSIRLLRETVKLPWSPDPIADLSHSLRQAGARSALFAETLSTWEGPT